MRIAVVLCNLGAPGNLSEVKEFLFNLFYDRRIIVMPNPFRFLLAKFIACARHKKSQGIYASIGGGSPLLEITNKQAELLEESLKKKNSSNEYKTFVFMRYSKPFAKDIIGEIEDFCPDKIILLPLYPHFSTTTTESAIVEFDEALVGTKLEAIPLKKIDHFFDNEKFVESQSNLISKFFEDKGLSFDNSVVLFSAHSLPESIIKNGDPYQRHIEENVELVVKKLNIKNLKHKISYQSKVGLQKWIGPSTESVIAEFPKNMNLVIVPISFVSENSETLAELDIQYQELAEKYGVNLSRVQTQGENKIFIDSLTELCLDAKIKY